MAAGFLLGVVLGPLLLRAADAQLVAEADAIGVEFMGSSGGMKVFNLNEAAEGFLMVQQDELLEVDAAGEMVVPPNRMSMAGGDAAWTALQEEDQGGGRTAYSTKFTKTEDDGKKFTLTAHVTRSAITTTDNVPCSACSGGTSGECQNAADLACSPPEVGPPEVCPVETVRCSEPITITSDTLKFSIVVSGWDFKGADHQLTYAMSVKDKSNGNEAPTVTENPGGATEIVVPGSGWLNIPTSGVIVGGAQRVPVDVGVTTRQQGSQLILDYVFPHFPEGTSMYYDPTLSTVGGGSGLSTTTIVALSLMGAAAAGGLLVLGNRYRQRNRYGRSIKNVVVDKIASRNYEPVAHGEDAL